MKKVHLISNANSGKGAGGTIKEMAERVSRELNFKLIHHHIEDPKTLDQLAEKTVQSALEDGGMVIAAGGDGTIRSVAEKVQGHPIRFGVLACGTFNFFARTHQLPEDTEQAFRLALQGEEQKVRLGEVNGRIFLINASLGLYAKSIRDREASTKRWGRNRVVVVIAGLFSLFKQHRLLDVTLTNENVFQKLRTPTIFIGNNGLQLRDLSMDVAECMKRDRLAVVLMKPLNNWEKIRIIFHGMARHLDNDKGLQSFCVDELVIDSHSPVHTVALDGEMFQMKTPLQVKALPGILNLVKLAPKVM